MRDDIRAKLMRRTRKTPTCWLWTGCRSIGGYGQICTGGGQRAYTHRISWEVHRGPIAGGMYVLHRCDNPPCVNPDHLFLGSKGDNNRDAIKKRRGWVGELNGSARLTWDAVRKIRSARAIGASLVDLGKRFHVDPSTIGLVVRNHTWVEPTK